MTVPTTWSGLNPSVPAFTVPTSSSLLTETNGQYHCKWHLRTYTTHTTRNLGMVLTWSWCCSHMWPPSVLPISLFEDLLPPWPSWHFRWWVPIWLALVSFSPSSSSPSPLLSQSYALFSQDFSLFLNFLTSSLSFFTWISKSLTSSSQSLASQKVWSAVSCSYT